MKKKPIEMKPKPRSDFELTKELCHTTLENVGADLLDAYPVIRNSEEVIVPLDKLTPKERRAISEALDEMGAAEIREGNALQREATLLERSRIFRC
jgi:hypothetical protein